MGEFYLWSDFVPHETAWVSCKSLKDAAEILESWFNESPAEKYKEMVKSISNGGRRHDRLQVGNIIFEAFHDDKLVGYDTIFHGVYVRLLPAYYNDLNQHNWVLVIGDKHFVCETPGEHTSRFSMNDKGKTLRELLLANIPGAKEHEYEDWCLYSGKYGERGLQNSPGGWAAVGGNYSEGRHEIWWCPDEENPEMFQIELDWCVNGKRQVIVCLTGERSLEGAKTTALTMALLRISGKKPDYGEW